MNLTYNKYKAELSSFYRIGYATSFRDVVFNIKEFSKDMPPLFQRQSEDLILSLYQKFNCYPCIVPEVPDEDN
jgi:hypothetical protein